MLYLCFHLFLGILWFFSLISSMTLCCSVTWLKKKLYVFVVSPVFLFLASYHRGWKDDWYESNLLEFTETCFVASCDLSWRMFHMFEKNVYPGFRWKFYIHLLSPSGLICHLMPLLPYFFSILMICWFKWDAKNLLIWLFYCLFPPLVC